VWILKKTTSVNIRRTTSVNTRRVTSLRRRVQANVSVAVIVLKAKNLPRMDVTGLSGTVHGPYFHPD